MEGGFSYSAAAGLVFAISATSSVVQPLFLGEWPIRPALPWLLPASEFRGGRLDFGSAIVRLRSGALGVGAEWPGVAAFHPEAARKAHLASGDRRTTGMSLFSVGGGLGFLPAPR